MKPTYYDEDYYEHGKGYHGYEDAGRFGDDADTIITRYQPLTVLDFGCAKGFLVKALRERDVCAYGYEVSKYAIEHADPSVKEFVSNRMKKVDLIVSIDVWEHIPLTELAKTREKLRKYGSRFYFKVGTVNTPDWQHDASHVSIYELDFWRRFMPEATWEESL